MEKQQTHKGTEVTGARVCAGGGRLPLYLGFSDKGDAEKVNLKPVRE